MTKDREIERLISIIESRNEIYERAIKIWVKKHPDHQGNIPSEKEILDELLSVHENKPSVAEMEQAAEIMADDPLYAVSDEYLAAKEREKFMAKMAQKRQAIVEQKENETRIESPVQNSGPRATILKYTKYRR